MTAKRLNTHIIVFVDFIHIFYRKKVFTLLFSFKRLLVLNDFFLLGLP